MYSLSSFSFICDEKHICFSSHISDYLLWLQYLWLSEKDESDCKFVSFSPDQFNGLWQLHLLNGNVVREVRCQCVCGGHSCGMYVWQAWLDPVWSIDSVPGGSSRPHICIVGFIRCLEERQREELIWQHVPSLWLAELSCRRQPFHQWETRTGEAWRGVRRMVRGAWQSFRGVYCAHNRARTAAELKYRLLCNLPDL